MKFKLNIPNCLTILRILLVLPLMVFILKKTFLSLLLSLLIFGLASLTDYLDGKLARFWSDTTKFGKFMDPLADKILVISAFTSLLFIEDEIVPLWMVLLVIIREISITGLRLTAINKNTEMETMFFGKAKATFQYITIIIIICLLCLKSYYTSITKTFDEKVSLMQFTYQFFEGKGGELIQYLPLTLMSITMFLTVGSGISYIYKNWNLFTSSLSR